MRASASSACNRSSSAAPSARADASSASSSATCAATPADSSAAVRASASSACNRSSCAAPSARADASSASSSATCAATPADSSAARTRLGQLGLQPLELRRPLPARRSQLSLELGHPRTNACRLVCRRAGLGELGLQPLELRRTVRASRRELGLELRDLRTHARRLVGRRTRLGQLGLQPLELRRPLAARRGQLGLQLGHPRTNARRLVGRRTGLGQLGLQPLELRRTVAARRSQRLLELGHTCERSLRLGCRRTRGLEISAQRLELGRGLVTRRSKRCLAFRLELGAQSVEVAALLLEIGDLRASALQLALELGCPCSILGGVRARGRGCLRLGERCLELVETRLPLSLAQLEQLPVDRRLEAGAQLHHLELVLDEKLLGLAGRRSLAARCLELPQKALEPLDLRRLGVRQPRVDEQALGDLDPLPLVHQLQLQLVDPPLQLLHGRLELHGPGGSLDRSRAALFRLQDRDRALALLERPLAVGHHRLELLQDLLALLAQAPLELELVRLAERSTQRARTIGLRHLVEAALDLLPVELVVDSWPSHYPLSIDLKGGGLRVAEGPRAKIPPTGGTESARSTHDVVSGCRCRL